MFNASFQSVHKDDMENPTPWLGSKIGEMHLCCDRWRQIRKLTSIVVVDTVDPLLMAF